MKRKGQSPRPSQRVAFGALAVQFYLSVWQGSGFLCWKRSSSPANGPQYSSTQALSAAETALMRKTGLEPICCHLRCINPIRALGQASLAATLHARAGALDAVCQHCTSSRAAGASQVPVECLCFGVTLAGLTPVEQDPRQCRLKVLEDAPRTQGALISITGPPARVTRRAFTGVGQPDDWAGESVGEK